MIGECGRRAGWPLLRPSEIDLSNKNIEEYQTMNRYIQNLLSVSSVKLIPSLNRLARNAVVIALAAPFSFGVFEQAQAGCNKEADASTRICTVDAYYIASRMSDIGRMAANGDDLIARGPNNHDLILFTENAAGDSVIIAELSFWQREFKDYPPNGHHAPTDRYSFSVPLVSYDGILDQLRAPEPVRLIIQNRTESDRGYVATLKSNGRFIPEPTGS